MVKPRFIALWLVLITLAPPALPQPVPASAVPADDAIREILTGRVGERGDRIGIVVGVIEPQGRRVVAYGSAGTDARPLDGHTVFEIGSVTKVFTALLLADMTAAGEVALEDAAARYLPAGVRVPSRGGREIRLIDLAMHRAALPRLPGNLEMEDPRNPYAAYSVEQLYRFLSGYELPRDIGSQYEYSNLGAGLLGHVLSLAASADYEALVRARISAPLGMASTAVSLSRDMQARLATGHDERFEETPAWDLPTLAGAGGLRSTANDLLSFLALHLGYRTSSLARALPAMLAVRRPAGPGAEVALGWHIRHRDSGDEGIVTHGGGTGGYRAFVGYDPITRSGVVVLTNVASPAGVDDIGLHLLDPSFPLIPADSPLLAPPRERTEIALEPAVLETYVGLYEIVPGMLMTITRDGDRLSAALTGQGAAEIYPESEREFFYKIVDAQIEFDRDDGGRVRALTLHQNGRAVRAERVE